MEQDMMTGKNAMDPVENAPEPEAQTQQMQGSDASLPEAQTPAGTALPVPDETHIQAQQVEGEAILNAQLQSIQALDPSIKSLAELQSWPEHAAFERLFLGEGYDMVTAFKLADYDRLAKGQAALEQAMINGLRAKQHLMPVGGGSEGEQELSDETIAQYRAFNPKWSKAQIRRHHRSYMASVNR